MERNRSRLPQKAKALALHLFSVGHAFHGCSRSPLSAVPWAGHLEMKETQPCPQEPSPCRDGIHAHFSESQGMCRPPCLVAGDQCHLGESIVGPYLSRQFKAVWRACDRVHSQEAAMSWIKTEEQLWFSRAKKQRGTCKGPAHSRKELSTPETLKEARCGGEL